MYNNFLIRNIIVGVSLVLCLLVWLAAYRSGKNQAQAAAVLHNVAASRNAFNYFFQDQGRFPTEAELADANLMRQYLSPYPPANLTAGSCKQSLAYQRPFPKQYNLQFCLAAASGSYRAGSSVITVSQ